MMARPTQQPPAAWVFGSRAALLALAICSLRPAVLLLPSLPPQCQALCCARILVQLPCTPARLSLQIYELCGVQYGLLAAVIWSLDTGKDPTPAYLYEVGRVGMKGGGCMQRHGHATWGGRLLLPFIQTSSYRNLAWQGSSPAEEVQCLACIPQEPLFASLPSPPELLPFINRLPSSKSRTPSPFLDVK